ncbi:MAG: hypothetical protein KHY44_15865, partial [Clostridiales bacterium]|nr:hypothetical protein [Clostridiales bacterium]
PSLSIPIGYGLFYCTRVKFSTALTVNYYVTIYILRNRIKALKISKCLIEKDESMQVYAKDELEKALPPVISIINKTEKAQSKYDEGTTPFKRFSPIISAMYISKALIEKEIAQRDPS